MDAPPRPVHPRLLRRLGAHSDDGGLYRRAIGWAVLFATMLLQIGLDDKPTYATVGRATIERLGAGADSRAPHSPSGPQTDPMGGVA